MGWQCDVKILKWLIDLTRLLIIFKNTLFHQCLSLVKDVCLKISHWEFFFKADRWPLNFWIILKLGDTSILILWELLKFSCFFLYQIHHRMLWSSIMFTEVSIWAELMTFKALMMLYNFLLTWWSRWIQQNIIL
jgi:hypothetical protein